MKYDLSKKPTRGAQRTLEAFSNTMFQLVSKHPFEEISVNQLCEICNYPRATFYNYFDDKYDLLEYCWYVLSEQIDLQQFTQIPSEQVLFVYFGRIYDLLDERYEWLKKILKFNSLNSSLILSFIEYLKKQTREIFYTCITSETQQPQIDIPVELLADHYSNTLLLVLEWIFFKQNKTDKELAHRYLKSFLVL